jgi:uncharacterized heparinase superfamily protein
VVSVILKYWNTLRYLYLSQITARIWKTFKKGKIDLSPAGDLRAQCGKWVEPARRTQRMVGESSFCFLNVFHDLGSADDWNNNQWGKLWIYNLHYFDDLTAVDADQRVELHKALIHRWIVENPPGKGNGWEAYSSSLRIVNWIKWVLAGNKLEDDWLHALAIQVRYLSQNLETHLLGNHLFANAKALLFAGLIFDGAEAEKWYQIGLQLVEQELLEQVLEDGGNFELSTMYHLIFLEDLLDLVNIHVAYEHAIPKGVEERIAPMFHWLETMCHPDGEISFFNDAALGVTPSVDQIKSYMLRISGLAGLKRFPAISSFPLNPENQICPVKNILIDLPASGYSRVELGDAVALIDRAAVGPDYQPGHAHADTLSFELSLFGQRVIVNSGTSVYGTSEQRQLERGTVVHSTVVVDGENSSEVWDGFRVARRARVFGREQSEIDGIARLSACHDGYKRLAGKPVHCRAWLFEEGLVTISDTVIGRGRHEVVSVLPLHPYVKVVTVDNDKVVLDVLGHLVTVTADGEGLLDVVRDCYHPEFGLSVENRKIMFRCNAKLPIKITTRIHW